LGHCRLHYKKNAYRIIYLNQAQRQPPPSRRRQPFMVSCKKKMRKIYKNVIFIHLLLRLLAVDKLMSTESEIRGGKIWGIVWAAGLIVDSSLLKPPSGWPLSYEKIWDEYIECRGIEGKCVARTMIIFLLLLIQFGIFIDVLWSELQMKLCGSLLDFYFCFDWVNEAKSLDCLGVSCLCRYFEDDMWMNRTFSCEVYWKSYAWIEFHNSQFAGIISNIHW